jgi:hypothetical protein
MQTVKEQLAGLRIGEPRRHRNLVMYPLLGAPTAEAPAEQRYLTLDEALKRELVEVTEVSSSGSVPELTVHNRAPLPVLLLDGEELQGAMQNRTLNLSILVPAATTLTVPVTCVEAGRWNSVSDAFRTSPQAHYAEGRARKQADVSLALRTRGVRDADQLQVWAGISNRLEAMAVPSNTGAMSDLYDAHGGNLDTFAEQLTPVAGQRGAVFGVNGRVFGLDLFDVEPTLRLLLPKIVRSYALDAVALAGRQQPNPEGRGGEALVQQFLGELAATPVDTFPALGIGQDLRFQSEQLVGGGLWATGAWEALVHLSAFKLTPPPAPRSGRRPGIMTRARLRATGRRIH